jgi:hypothetical protein
MPPSDPSHRAITAVRILTWLAVGLYFIVYFIVPRGITVFWSLYLILFTPIVAANLSALIAFVYCRVRRYPISVAYALISVAVFVGVWYTTWFELRLRWYEVLR